jgi:TetR/AcrR family transcriptional regulator, transcriptional repressor for nem operon
MRNPEYTRHLIVSKALPIFNTKGYHATSLSDITKATGITKGAIYGNFKNKDEVVAASFDHGVHIVMETLGAIVRAQPTAPKKLHGILDYYSEYILNPPIPGGCPILNTSIEADDNYPFLQAKVIRTIDQMRESIAKILLRGIREGQIKKEVDVQTFATFFYATIEGAISLSRVEGDDRSYRSIKAVLKKMIDEMAT